MNISVVINTFNEEKNIERVIASVKWAGEVIVCDMHSDDKTVEIAKKMGAKIFFYQKSEYVEPARNFAISKASYKWILILDADEQIPETLSNRLKTISEEGGVDYVRVPRKNLIFNKWMQTSMWWPDFNIRFFKKGKVKWSDKIHRPPLVEGQGLDLEAEEESAIIHHNYQTVGQFIERMNRYTQVESEELIKDGYEFRWQDVLEKPLNEFLSRFFSNKGYQEGLHGLALSLLQAFSFLVVYLKVWEHSKFKEQSLELKQLSAISNEMSKYINYWFKYSNLSKNPVKRLLQKLRK